MNKQTIQNKTQYKPTQHEHTQCPNTHTHYKTLFNTQYKNNAKSTTHTTKHTI